MLFSLLKHYLDLYISDTALKVFQSLYCFTTSLCHCVENDFHRLWGTGIPDATFPLYICHLKTEINFNMSEKSFGLLARSANLSETRVVH